MNNRKTKHNKIFLVILFVVIIICSIGIYGIKTAKANIIKEYETQIASNNLKINQITEIKNQLHITAELLRDEATLNNGLDSFLSQKWHDYNVLHNKLISENDVLKDKITMLKKEIENNKVFIGYFTISHYSIDSCGKTPSHPAYGITATGTRATPGRTIAVDPTIIPYGTNVIINGHTYIAEDTGGGIKGNKIDICVSSNSEAYKKGVLYKVPVYIIADVKQ